jgi:hypothetical protein
MFQRIMVALLKSTSPNPAKKYGGYAQNVDTLGLPKLSNVPTDKDVPNATNQASKNKSVFKTKEIKKA